MSEINQAYNEIKKELKIINEARDKATKIISKGMPHYNDYLIGHDKDGTFVLADMNRNMANWKNDLEFFILSANRIAQLTKAIEVMAEALEFYSNRKNWEHWHNHDVGAHQEWNTFRPEIYNGGERANNSLKQVSKILKGDKDDGE